MMSLSGSVSIVRPLHKEVGLDTTHNTSSSSMHNSKDRSNGSKAKTTKGAMKHSKEQGTKKEGTRRSSRKTKHRQSSHLLKALSIPPQTPQEPPYRQTDLLVPHQCLLPLLQ